MVVEIIQVTTGKNSVQMVIDRVATYMRSYRRRKLERGRVAIKSQAGQVARLPVGRLVRASQPLYP
jgi:phage gp45-like